MTMSLAWEGSVALVTWHDGENRVNLDSLARLHEVLDELERHLGPFAVVMTGAGKFFSNGLDLERFGANPSELGATLSELHRSVARLLLFPAYTVAALNGHVFAAGALLASGFDYRVMRRDRGYWCMNEADIGYALDEKLAAILFNALPRATAVDAMLTARRFAADEALHAGIVQEVADESQVVARAIEVAAAMAVKDRRTLAAHKRVAYGDVAAYLGFISPA